MSIFQKKVDELIKKELKNVSKVSKKNEDDAKDIHKKQTIQSRINELVEKENEKKNKKDDR